MREDLLHFHLKHIQIRHNVHGDLINQISMHRCRGGSIRCLVFNVTYKDLLKCRTEVVVFLMFMHRVQQCIKERV